MRCSPSERWERLQRMAPRPVVRERVGRILADAPRHPQTGYPASYGHHDLARDVYGTNDPTAAQLSAVRRAVAQLVAAGNVERDGWAQRGERPGARFRRAMTADDHDARIAACVVLR